MTAQNKGLTCPQCGQVIDASPANRYRPFCSQRCKLVDLGSWLDESNHIADPDGSVDPMAVGPTHHQDDH